MERETLLEVEGRAQHEAQVLQLSAPILAALIVDVKSHDMHHVFVQSADLALDAAEVLVRKWHERYGHDFDEF